MQYLLISKHNKINIDVLIFPGGLGSHGLEVVAMSVSQPGFQVNGYDLLFLFLPWASSVGVLGSLDSG